MSKLLFSKQILNVLTTNICSNPQLNFNYIDKPPYGGQKGDF